MSVCVPFPSPCSATASGEMCGIHVEQIAAGTTKGTTTKRPNMPKTFSLLPHQGLHGKRRRGRGRAPFSARSGQAIATLPSGVRRLRQAKHKGARERVSTTATHANSQEERPCCSRQLNDHFSSAVVFFYQMGNALETLANC